jgi:hypothetical protein
MRGVPPLSSKYLLEILGSAARETPLPIGPSST